jgi:hypothetical protein
MGVIGTAISESLPTVGTTAGPTWASDLNAFLEEVTTRLEALIDSGSILLTTGDVKHSTRYVQQGAAAGQSLTATWTPATGATAGYWLGAGAADTVEFSPPIERNRRITALRMTGRSVGTAWTFKAWLVTHSTGARAQLGTTQTSGTATSIETLNITGLTTTLASGQSIVLEWTSGAALTRCIAVTAEYDRQVAT